MSSFQQKLKAVMAVLQWNAPELARRSGVPLASIKSILQGRSKHPRSSTVAAISRACGYPVADFISPLPEIDPSLLLSVAQPKRASLAQLPAELVEPVVLEGSAPQYSLPLFKKTLRAVEVAAATVGFDLEGRDFIRHQICTILYDYALERRADYGGKAVIDMVLAYWLLNNERESAEAELAGKELVGQGKNVGVKKVAGAKIRPQKKRHPGSQIS